MATDVGEIRARVTLNNVEFMRKIDESKKKAGELGDKAKKVSKDIKAIQKASLVVGGAVATAIGGTVKMAADFEQKLQDIKAVSGATTEEMAKIHDLAIEMGAKTKYSAAEAAEGIEELIKAGVSLTDILNGGLEGALNLATAGELSLADAAQVASTALNAFRDDHLKVADAADILSGAANASATDVKEMAMGLSQASAVASGMGMTFRDTSTALALFAQYGLRGSDAGTSLKTMLLNLIPQTKQQKELFKELGLVTKDGANIFYDANGKLKSFAEISGILHDKLKNLSNEQRQATLQILFGTDAVRAANIMFRAGADGVNQMWKEMSKVKAVDVAKTKMDSLKGSFEEFRGALETLSIEIGEEFLPTFRKIIDGATDFIEWLSKLNPALITTGLEAAGAAAGVGLLLTAITKISLALRAFALTPVGAAITAISLLTGLFVGLRSSMSKTNEVTIETIKATQSQVKTIDDAVNTFEELRNKNALTNAELLRYMDIQSELQKTTDPSKIKALKDEMAELEKKSGLSHDQLQKFLDANKKIIEASPETERAISAEGNALAKNADSAKKAAQAKYELLQAQTKGKFIELLNSIDDKLAKEKDLISEIQSLEKDREGIVDNIRKHEDTIAKANETINKYKDSQNEKEQSLANQAFLSKRAAEAQLETERKALQTIQNKIIGKQKELETTRKDIAELEKTKATYEQLILSSVGLTSERGKGLQVLQKQLDKLEDQKSKLGLLHSQGKLNTEEYETQVEKIDDQIKRIKTAQGELREMNDIAGKTIYKEVKIKTDPSIVKIDDDLKKAVFKTVHLTVDQQRFLVNSTKAYNDMVRNRHQGGPVRPNAFELPKYHEGGSPAFDWTPPMFTERDIRVLGNEMILTEGQQANLFRWIKNAQLPQASADFTETNALLAAIERAIRESGGDIVVMLDGKQIEPSVSRAQGATVRETKRRRGIV